MSSKKKTFEYAMCKSIKSNIIVPQEDTWEEIVKGFRHPQPTTDKHAPPLFSPANFMENTRSKDNVRNLALFAIDFDNPQVKDGKPPVTMEDVCLKLAPLGINYILAASWSNTDDFPRFRVVIPLNNPIEVRFWHRWSPVALEVLGLGGFRHAMDKSCLKNVACIYYLPSSPDGDPLVVSKIDGKFLNVPIPKTIKKDFVHVKLGKPKGSKRGFGDFTTLDVVRLFDAHGCYQKPGSEPGLHIVTCPWMDEHTNPKVDTATCIKEGTLGHQWPSFQCFHDHCSSKTMKDVVDLWTDATIYCERAWDPLEEEARIARGEKQTNEPASVSQKEEITVVRTADGKLKIKLKDAKLAKLIQEDVLEAPAPLPSDGNKHPYTPDPAYECKDGFPISIIELLRRYVYVSGMGKVLDRKTGGFMGSQDLKATIMGRQFQSLDGGWTRIDYFKLPSRKMCTPDQVVFNPTKKIEFPMINLFTGFDHDTNLGAMDKDEIMERTEAVRTLIEYLCNEDTDYVLNWLAYPIKFPGAKMRSSLIIHGAQGLGKNLVFDRAMTLAYGKWSRIINQQDLDAPFNGWMTKKLYIVADEVATDRRKVDTSNLLKSWITGSVISVNEKNLPVREESNHCNFVFLSNNAIPIFVDSDDRRYCVVRVPEQAMNQEFYSAVAAELKHKDGLAWYLYLKNRKVDKSFIDLPVPNSIAKNNLKQSCRNSVDLFLDELGCLEDDGVQDLEAAMRGDNEMRLPYGAVTNASLYQAYRTWCKWNGESHPYQRRNFTTKGPQKRKWRRGRSSHYRFLLPVEIVEIDAWKIEAQIEEFDTKLVNYVSRRGVQ